MKNEGMRSCLRRQGANCQLSLLFVKALARNLEGGAIKLVAIVKEEKEEQHGRV